LILFSFFFFIYLFSILIQHILPLTFLNALPIFVISRYYRKSFLHTRILPRSKVLLYSVMQDSYPLAISVPLTYISSYILDNHTYATPFLYEKLLHNLVNPFFLTPSLTLYFHLYKVFAYTIRQSVQPPSMSLLITFPSPTSITYNLHLSLLAFHFR